MLGRPLPHGPAPSLAFSLLSPEQLLPSNLVAGLLWLGGTHHTPGVGTVGSCLWPEGKMLLKPPSGLLEPLVIRVIRA